MSDAWTQRLLHLNAEIVEADANLAVALRGFSGRTGAEDDVTAISRQIRRDLTRLTLLRRLRDHHLQTVQVSV